jgi:hypothetical protein
VITSTTRSSVAFDGAPDRGSSDNRSDGRTRYRDRPVQETVRAASTIRTVAPAAAGGVRAARPLLHVAAFVSVNNTGL